MKRTVVAAAVLIAAWSLIPFAIWWDGANPLAFQRFWETWAWGTLLTVLLFALVAILSGGRAVSAAFGAWSRVVAWPARRFVAVVAVLFAALAVLMCVFVFSGNPRNVDGFAQLWQARMLLAGHAWIAPPPASLIPNFGTLQVIVGPDKWYAQYPPGQSAVLAAGLAFGAWWLLNPALAVLLVWATWRVGRWCLDESAARLAALLLCVSPFAVAVAGSEMSHLGAATFAMLAAAFASDGAALAAGAALGVMAAFRPLDAVAAAVPVGVILLMVAPRRIAWCIAGGVLLSLPTLAFNQLTTGSWHRFGYTVLWGPNHSLGFHPVPFGTPLTPLRAIARSGLDLHQLNTYLFDAPFPILALLAIGFVAGRRAVAARDAVPMLAFLSLVAALFFYWWRDVFYGPRFLFSVVPWLMLLLARALSLLRRTGRVGEMAAGVAMTGVAFGLVTIGVPRIESYRAATPVFDLHPDRDAKRAGITHAVVVIPDGWGTRLIVRMWGAGIAPLASTKYYAAIDACTLESALDAPAPDLRAALDSLAARHRPGVPTDTTGDANLRLSPDRPLTPACRDEIATDRRGYIQYAPFLYLNPATLDGDVVWARDLGPRNAALFARYAGRAFYRYAPAAPGSAPVFTRITP